MLGKYNKNLTGAVITYKPDDIILYEKEAFDIQITIGNTPLSEGYFFTVKDPTKKSCSIKYLLEEYALNRNRRFELDIKNYPEFPFYMEELAQIYEKNILGDINLNIYVNKSTEYTPLNINNPALNHMSKCIFNDHSYNYALLDLVFDIEDDFYIEKELNLCITETIEQAVLIALNTFQSFNFSQHKLLTEKRILIEKLVSKNEYIKIINKEANTCEIKLTNAGKEKARLMVLESKKIRKKYSRFESVGIYPPALGIPNGYDARLQIALMDKTTPYNTTLSILEHNILFKYELGDSFFMDIMNNKIFYEILRQSRNRTHFGHDVISELINL